MPSQGSQGFTLGAPVQSLAKARQPTELRLASPGLPHLHGSQTALAMLDSRLSCALSVARITISLLQTPLRPCRLPHLGWLASDARYMVVVVRCNDVQLPASIRIISSP